MFLRGGRLRTFGIIGNGHVGTAVACSLLNSDADFDADFDARLKIFITYRGAQPKLKFKDAIDDAEDARKARQAWQFAQGNSEAHCTDQKTFKKPAQKPLDHAAVLWMGLELAVEQGSEQAEMFRRTKELLSGCDAVLWTFPLSDESMERFAEDLLSAGVRLFLLSSTSCYETTHHTEFYTEGHITCGFIDERAPLSTSQTRFMREENLRLKGAVVLPLSGLFGGTRNPVDWLRQGRVKNVLGCVNLIHHDDAGFCVSRVLVSPPLPGERINISASRPHFWNEIARESGCELALKSIDLRSKEVISKQVNSKQVISDDTHQNNGRVISNAKLLSLYPEICGHVFKRCP